MTRFGRMLLAVVFAWCLVISFAVAQQAGQQTADQDEPDAAAAQEIDLDAGPIDESATEAADPPATGNNAGQSERFIPSEQISQDLGVSYPVDI